MPAPVLEVQGLVRRVEGGACLRDLSFRLEPGEVMGIVGPGRSGKTDLLRALVGLLVTPPGMVSVLGGDPWSAAGRRRIGYVPALPALYEEFTCGEYLGFFAEAYAIDRHYRPYLVREALRQVRLQDQLDRPVSELRHYGQRRRLGLARALVHEPDLVVIDDALARLDRAEARVLIAILDEVRSTGKALVLASSFLADLGPLCSHLCLMVNHRPLACGEVPALLPKIARLKMMQVQVLEGPQLKQALGRLEGHPQVFHLSLSTRTHNLIRFLFDGSTPEVEGLLEELKAGGVSIVSYAEDPSFLGALGVV